MQPSVAFIILFNLLLAHSTLAQAPPTPTPDAEGNIYVIVQANDSLWGIAARAGIGLDELLTLNNLTEDSIITPGQKLLVGRQPPPPTPTVAIPPTSTPTRPPPPTATAVVPPSAAICLKAFSDLNRNGVHNPGEPFRAAVAFTIFNEEKVIANVLADGVSEPYCLENLEPGEYKITRSISPEETLTTAGDWTITLAPGNVVELAFGSYTAVTPTAANPETVGELPTGAAPLNQTEPLENGRVNSIFIGAALVVIFLLAIWLIRQTKKHKESSANNFSN
ncbi:MAG: LysM peptidoglycan-binding domain-containing protein [Chloroflexi bacterium]|nr:LysM peptidoglycan-binding domain-containing protein [Chloroflexota bacterium]